MRQDPPLLRQQIYWREWKERGGVEGWEDRSATMLSTVLLNIGNIGISVVVGIGSEWVIIILPLLPFVEIPKNNKRGGRNRRGDEDVREEEGEGDKSKKMYTYSVTDSRDADAPTNNGDDDGWNDVVNDN